MLLQPGPSPSACSAGPTRRSSTTPEPYGLNPSLTSAAINRGMLHYQQSRFQAAAADLESALATATSRKDRGVIHYNLSLVDIARGDRAAARSNLVIAEAFGHQAAKTLRERLRDDSPKPY